MEQVEKHLRKAKTWNMVLLVLGLISVIFGVINLPSLFKVPDKAPYEAMGSYGLELYEQITGPFQKVNTIVGLIVSIILLICYFKANSALKENKVPTKIPYYGYLAWTIISLIIAFITTPKGSVMEGIDISKITMIIGTVFQFIIAIPAILVIVHLFKAEPEE
ncbi:hypothetical protein NRIC_27820 [Enterococcus florum]|uniref:DUF1648 domain-containing protein n=1 Tax=Enterococcus florum TaxID=2480627 RepID=A0A4P5PEW4_9ENTE|nr:hypothetical protein [Enterococcus florum]GCF94891.1 hypothetical protein NRIC_27820 [Enterococcus florum]